MASARWIERPKRLVLAPGTYAQVPAWRSRAHWLDEVLPAAASQGWRVLRSHHIAPDTFIRIMAAHAQHADDDTGRGCIPTVEHLQELARCSERTVQRARAAARELGIAVEVFRGRHLTLDERIEAYDAGQTHRGWASVYALGCPRWLAGHLDLPLAAAYPQLNGSSVDSAVESGTPPIGRSTKDPEPLVENYSSANNAEQRAARAASTEPHGHPRTPRKRGGRFNPAAMALAQALQRRIRTFAGVHPARLAPTLSRFATAPEPWTAAEMQDVLERVLRAKGWTWLSTPQHPPAYLARLLREVEHIDQAGGATEEHRTADRLSAAGVVAGRPGSGHAARELARRNLRAAERAELDGYDLCTHGVAGADPLTAVAARCAFCRRIK